MNDVPVHEKPKADQGKSVEHCFALATDLHWSLFELFLTILISTPVLFAIYRFSDTYCRIS